MNSYSSYADAVVAAANSNFAGAKRLHDLLMTENGGTCKRTRCAYCPKT